MTEKRTDDGRLLLRPPARFRLPEVSGAFARIGRLGPDQPAVIDFAEVERFDSSTVAFIRYLRLHFPAVEVTGLGPSLARAETEFVEAAPVREEAVAVRQKPMTGAMSTLGGRAGRAMERAFRFLLMLVDESFHVFRYLFKDRRGVYPGETWNQLYFMGYRSYPITLFLVFLVGVTISVSSAKTLHLFGADIYLADMIGLSMLRELVPLMVGVILAGKVGAAVAAELATMSVLEEVDALRTMSVTPERFLMVPRLLGITMAVPLLVAIADVVGIAGGAITADMKFGIPPVAFIREMMATVDWQDFMWSVVKTVVFGWAVVIGSGYKGLTVGRSAAEVGRATTESVVLSISMIIIIDCIFAFIIY